MAHRCGMSKCVIGPNFATIGHSMIEISRCSNFNIAAVRHLGFLNSQNLNGRQTYEGEHASSYAKFRGNRWNRCRDMAIFRFFKMAATAILDFSNFKFLTVGRLKSAELLRYAKFGQNRSNRGRVMAIFRFCKMAVAAILDFSNFKFLTVGQLKRVEVHRRAKFGQNQSKRSGHVAIFRFFKMAAATILDFSNFKFLTVDRLKRAELRRRAKFGRNRSKRGRVMAIFRFSRWRPPPSWIFQISNF